MHLRGAATVRHVDLATFAAVPAALLHGWQELTFDRGTLVDSAGVRREGLRVEVGSHPLAGTTYTVVTMTEEIPTPTDADMLELDRLRSAPDADIDAVTEAWRARRHDAARAKGTLKEVFHTASLELLDIASDGARLRVQDRTTSTIGAVVSYEQEASEHGSTSLRADIDGGITGHWLVRGAVTGSAEATFDPSASSGGPELRLTAKGAFKRAKATAVVLVIAGASGTYEVAIDVHVRGRGLARPIAAVAACFGGRSARRGFASAMEKLPAMVDAFVADLERTLRAPPTAQSIAQRTIDELVLTIAVTLPDA
jgi:hypothetical protein